jgi:hypothetical protein
VCGLRPKKQCYDRQEQQFLVANMALIVRYSKARYSGSMLGTLSTSFQPGCRLANLSIFHSHSQKSDKCGGREEWTDSGQVLATDAGLGGEPCPCHVHSPLFRRREPLVDDSMLPLPTLPSAPTQSPRAALSIGFRAGLTQSLMEPSFQPSMFLPHIPILFSAGGRGPYEQ